MEKVIYSKQFFDLCRMQQALQFGARVCEDRVDVGDRKIVAAEKFPEELVILLSRYARIFGECVARTAEFHNDSIAVIACECEANERHKFLVRNVIRKAFDDPKCWSAWIPPACAKFALSNRNIAKIAFNTSNAIRDGSIGALRD
jgi:hypothetical protein